MKAVAPFAVILLLAALWLGVLYGVALWTGWRALAEHYAGGPPPDTNVWMLRETLGGVKTDAPILGMNNVQFDESPVKIGADASGIFLALPLLFRPFHPPLHIPWSAVQAVWIEKRVLGFPLVQFFRLSFAATPRGFIDIDRALAEALAARSGGAWRPPVTGAADGDRRR